MNYREATRLVTLFKEQDERKILQGVREQVRQAMEVVNRDGASYEAWANEIYSYQPELEMSKKLGSGDSDGKRKYTNQDMVELMKGQLDRDKKAVDDISKLPHISQEKKTKSRVFGITKKRVKVILVPVETLTLIFKIFMKHVISFVVVTITN